MQKTSKINQIAIDKTPITCYNTDMTNNDTNTNNKTFSKGTTDMTNMTHDVRVIKHIGGVFANFTTVKEAVAYMRNWDSNQMHSWYIINADGVRLQMNDAGTNLVVTYSGLGVIATK